MRAIVSLLLAASAAVQAAHVTHDGPAADEVEKVHAKSDVPSKDRVQGVHANQDEPLGDQDEPAGDVIQADIDDLSITIQWENNFTAVAELTDNEKDDCIFRGSFVKDKRSRVLVTGCYLNEEDLAIQFESKKFGDALFSTTPEGYLRRSSLEDNNFDEYVFYSDSNDEPAPGRNGRVRRQDDDYDFYDYDLSPFESADLKDLPNLDEYETDVGDLPDKIELDLNIYIDPSFRNLHGSRTKTVLRQILAQAGQLYKHQSLNTKVQLVHNNWRFYDSNQHIKFNTRDRYGPTIKNDFYNILPRLLRAPYTIDGHPVAHVYFTVPDGGSATGVALAGSVCATQYRREPPRAIIAWSSVAVTGVTLAHELGHILGMYHDFSSYNSDGRRYTCSGKRSGRFILAYGNNPRRTSWSSCSNLDFRTYYFKVALSRAGGFCLAQTGGARGRSCRAEEYQCLRGGRCIPGYQRCDGLARNCPGGDDEIDCAYDYDPFL